jgi:hypothetical protein
MSEIRLFLIHITFDNYSVSEAHCSYAITTGDSLSLCKSEDLKQPFESICSSSHPYNPSLLRPILILSVNLCIGPSGVSKAVKQQTLNSGGIRVECRLGTASTVTEFYCILLSHLRHMPNS